MIERTLVWMMELPPVCDVLFRVTVVLMGAWLLHVGLRRHHPVWRISVWRTATVALPAVALVTLLTPGLRVAITPPILASQSPLSGHFVLREFPSDAIAEMAASVDPACLPEGQAADGLPPEPASVTSTSMRSTGAGAPSMGTLFGVLWGVGSVALLLRWVVASFWVRRWIRDSAPAPANLVDPMHRIAELLRCGTLPELRVSARASTPFVAGLRRPVIVIPREMLDADRSAELRAVLAHELSHLRSRDTLWMAWMETVSAILWFHPLAWPIRRTHARACEENCDASAVNYLGDREFYSSTLAGIALSASGRPRRAAAIAMARPAEIVVRLHRLGRNVEAPLPTRRRLGVVGMVGLVAVTGLGGLKPGWAQISETSDSPVGPEVPARILQFPADRSLGSLFVEDDGPPREADAFTPWFDTWGNWDYLGEARGEVHVPAGKRLHLSVGSEGWKDLRPLNRLKPDDIYMISFAQWSQSPLPGDAAVRHLARLTGLQVLDLQGTEVGSGGLRFVKGMKSLEKLYLPQRVNDAGLMHLAGLTSLRVLYLHDCKVTDDGVGRLVANLPALEELYLGGRELTLTSDALSRLSKATRLRYLRLWGDWFDDDALARLANLPGLRILSLSGCEIGEDALVHVGKLKRLEGLNLFNASVTDAGLAHLRESHALRQLDLGFRGNSRLTDAGIAHLAGLTSLEELELPGTISDEGLVVVSRFKRLRLLEAGTSSSSDISDEGLARLANLSLLEELLIGGRTVTDEGIGQLARLTRLRKLTIFSVRALSDEGLAALGTLTSLQRLTLMLCPNITLAGLNRLDGLTELTILQVQGKIQAGEVPLDIGGLNKLEDLTLNAPIRDADLRCLAGLTRLKKLHLPGGNEQLTDAGLAPLHRLRALQMLTIGGPALTDEGLTHLSSLDKVISLRLTNGEFTDAGLRRLEGLRSLRGLTLPAGTEVSEEAEDRLREAILSLQMVRFEGGNAGAGFGMRSR